MSNPQLTPGMYHVKEDLRVYAYGDLTRVTFDGVRRLEVTPDLQHILYFEDGAYEAVPPGWKWTRSEAEAWIPSVEPIEVPGSVSAADSRSKDENPPTGA